MIYIVFGMMTAYLISSLMPPVESSRCGPQKYTVRFSFPSSLKKKMSDIRSDGRIHVTLMYLERSSQLRLMMIQFILHIAVVLAGPISFEIDQSEPLAWLGGDVRDLLAIHFRCIMGLRGHCVFWLVRAIFGWCEPALKSSLHRFWVYDAFWWKMHMTLGDIRKRNEEGIPVSLTQEEKLSYERHVLYVLATLGNIEASCVEIKKLGPYDPDFRVMTS